MFRPSRIVPALLVFVLLLPVLGCKRQVGEFRLLLGHEKHSLAPYIQDFCRERNWDCKIDYASSNEFLSEIASAELDYDALWPADTSIILEADSRHRVRHMVSLMNSPVVWGVNRQTAWNLSITGRVIQTPELIELVRDKGLRLLIPSPGHTFSGIAEFVARFHAMSGQPDTLVLKDLDNPDIIGGLKDLFQGSQRISEDPGWIKDLYIENVGQNYYDALIDFEASLIQANIELENRALPPFYLVYPNDGIVVSDHPLGYVHRGNFPDKQAFFEDMLNHFRSDRMRRILLSMGWRTSNMQNQPVDDLFIFRRDWGANLKTNLQTFSFPNTTTLKRLREIYDSRLRRPSLTIMCLDFSSEYKSRSKPVLKDVMELLFSVDTAKDYLPKNLRRDRFVAIPYSATPWIGEMLTVRSPTDSDMMVAKLAGLTPSHGNDAYACLNLAYRTIRDMKDINDYYSPGIILFSSVKSNGDPDRFESIYNEIGLDIPVFTIAHGLSNISQLRDIAEFTRGQMFDARSRNDDRQTITHAFQRALRNH